MNNLGLGDEELKGLGYQERCNFLNNNPIHVARCFRCKFEVYFEDIILDGPLGKPNYYAMRILFQGNGSFHSFMLILNAPKIHKKAVYIEFIKKRINAQMPDHFNNPEILLLLLLNFASPVVNILLRRQLLQNYLTLNLAFGRQEVLI